MAKKKTDSKQRIPDADTPIPLGSTAARRAALTAEMLKVGIFYMEEGGDPHWLARYFLMDCTRAWEKHKLEYQPNWSVTPIEIAEVAVSLKRDSFLPKNGFEHCDLPKMPLHELAVKWIAGAHHVLCLEQEMERTAKERETLSELNDYWIADDPNKSMIPVSVVLRLAGCDELKPTAKELATFGHSEASFKALSAADKHCIRHQVLGKYEVFLDMPLYHGNRPERMGPPVKIKPGRWKVENGMCKLSFSLAEDILAMRKAKEQRIREVRSDARSIKKRDSMAPVGTRKISKAQESI